MNATPISGVLAIMVFPVMSSLFGCLHQEPMTLVEVRYEGPFEELHEEILNDVPEGSSIQDARTKMREKGYKCQLVGDADNQVRLLYCEKLWIYPLNPSSNMGSIYRVVFPVDDVSVHAPIVYFKMDWDPENDEEDLLLNSASKEPSQK